MAEEKILAYCKDGSALNYARGQEKQGYSTDIQEIRWGLVWYARVGWD